MIRSTSPVRSAGQGWVKTPPTPAAPATPRAPNDDMTTGRPMRLGNRPPHPLTHRQKRSIKLAVLVGCVLVLGSILMRASYREMQGIVVGNEIELSSAVEGTVATVHRRENESYRRGDKLVTLENGELVSQLDAVEQDLEEITRSLAIE